MSGNSMKPNLKDLGFEGWDFGVDEKLLNPLLTQVAKVVITYAFNPEQEGAEPSLSFPIEWSPRSDGFGGSAVTDPLIVYVNFPGLSAHGDTGPFLKFNLREALDIALEKDEEPLGSGYKLLRDSLRKLADDIDERIKPGEHTKEG